MTNRTLPRRITAVIFDHDGTMVNSLSSVAAATNAALVEHGYAACPADDIVANMFRATGPRMGFHARTDNVAEQERLNATFYRHARIMAPQSCSLYPGVSELVGTLKQQGLSLAVLSNNEGEVIRRVMKQLNILDAITAALGEEDCPAPKPDPRGALKACALMRSTPDSTVFVGDSHPDCDAAHNAGMYAIGVTWGIHTRTDMAPFGFDRLVDTPQELLKILLGSGYAHD